MIATAIVTAVVGVTMMSSGAAAARAPEEVPQLVLDPAVVQPGDSLVVSGSCGPEGAGQSIQVVLTGELSGQLVRVETDATGRFGADAEIPPQSPTGTSRVVAACGFGDDNPTAQLVVGDEDTQPTPTGTARSRVVERGDVGERVAWWQDRLNEWLALEGSELHPIAVDGIFGPETEAATVEFQQTMEGLDAQGAVGPLDRVELREAIAELEAHGAAPPVSRGDVDLRVAWWQDRLNEWLEFEGSELHPIAVDGIFGPETEAATIEFQQTVERLDPDGVVGPEDRVDLRDAIEQQQSDAPPVSRGDIGERVAWWQDRLNEWLDLAGSDRWPISVDGIFGPETEAATIEFQRTVERLDPDGVVGPRDRVDLERAIDDEMSAVDDEADPVGDLDTAAVESGGFPELGETALLDEIRIGAHQEFERITFEFVSGDIAYRVRYVDRPPTDPAGEPVEVEGSAMLEIHISGAAGVDLSGEEAEQSYEGPRRFTPEAVEVIREVALVEDFEGNLRWVVGLAAQTPFAVDEFSDPLRLVIDLQNL